MKRIVILTSSFIICLSVHPMDTNHTSITQPALNDTEAESSNPIKKLFGDILATVGQCIAPEENASWTHCHPVALDDVDIVLAPEDIDFDLLNQESDGLNIVREHARQADSNELHSKRYHVDIEEPSKSRQRLSTQQGDK